MYQTIEDFLNLVHLKKDRTDASIYKKLFIEIRDRYLDYTPVYTDGSRDLNSVTCAAVFPSNTVISMRLPDSAVTVEILNFNLYNYDKYILHSSLHFVYNLMDF